jgi:GNAT superfamily N-acetyltransferase
MEPFTRAVVTVTFLRMDRPPATPVPPLPQGSKLVRVATCSVPFYRYLYGTVGGPYLWWLRRAASDDHLEQLLGDPLVSIHVLYRGGEPAGFFELDARSTPDVNLAYFGLMPRAIGMGLGDAFLRAAVDAAWMQARRWVTVNTCTADHRRALPAYLRAGFRPLRTVKETWDIPVRLGLVVPEHLRG